MSDLISTLRAARIEQRLTQAEVADAVGVNLSSLKAWELAYQQPRLDNAQAWAHALGLRLRLEHDVRDAAAVLAGAVTDSRSLIAARSAAVTRTWCRVRRVKQVRSPDTGRFVRAGEPTSEERQ